MADGTWFDGFDDERLNAGELTLRVRQGGTAGAPPLLLLHGFPETSAMWQRVAQRLAPHFRLVLPDLRGYGDSDKPPATPDHASYSKRAMAADLAALMRGLGHERYFVAGHDRGGRVAHRLALDHPGAVRRLALLDIAPTVDMYQASDMRFAAAYYHWFFLIQPTPHPERMIASDPLHYLHWKLGAWGATDADPDAESADERSRLPRGPRFYEPQALAEYERCISRPDTIHAMCEDYRASAGIDIAHDLESRQKGERIACDLHLLWGTRGVVHALFDPLALWRAQCSGAVSGQALPCGHFIPEELPGPTADALLAFFGAP
jgi:haloacetate dehalogenase